MKNTLTDLNDYLFEQLERVSSTEITPDELDIQIKKTESVVKIAEQIIANGELAFKTMRHVDAYGYNTGEGPKRVPHMLDTQGEWQG